MNDWKIGTRVTVALTSMLALTIALGIFAATRIQVMEQAAQVIGGENLPSVIALGHIQAEVYHLAELLRQHAATDDPTAKATIEAQMVSLRVANAKTLQTLEARPSSPSRLALLNQVNADRAEFWLTLTHELNDEQKNKLKESSGKHAQGNGLAEQRVQAPLQRYLADLHQLINLHDSGAQGGVAFIQSSAAAANEGILLVVILCIAIAVPVNLLIVSSISVPIDRTLAGLDRVAAGDLTVVVEVSTKDEMGQMAHALNAALAALRSVLLEVAGSAATGFTASQQLAAAAEEIAGGAQQQAASLEETSASLEQITAAVRQTADNAGQASQLAIGCRESAESGQQVVSQAMEAMAEINMASAQIADIITTINEIAFQTNLLAVNAAVEAARAGEQGRGFAVVAAEVRSLAQRSAEASKEIRGLIQDTLGKVEKGCELVNRSGETLMAIIHSVKRVTELVGQIAAASAEQSTGVGQVNMAVTQMDQITQSNSAQTEELASTAQSFAHQAARLMELVDRFQLGVARRADEDTHEPRTPPRVVSMDQERSRRQMTRSPARLVTGAYLRRNQNGSGRAHAAPVTSASAAGLPDDAGFEEF